MLKLSSQNNIDKLLKNLPSKSLFNKDLLKLDLISIGEKFKQDKATITQDGVEVECETDPVSFKNVKLGKFKVTLDIPHYRLNFNYDGVHLLGFPYNFLSIKAIKPNYSFTDPVLFHPHISDGMICLGDAHYPVENCIRDRQLEYALTLIDNMLRSDGEDTNELIDRWNNYVCYNCKADSKKEPSFCEICSEDACKKCKISTHIGCGSLKGKKKPYLICYNCEAL